jgi:hypothetical protein
MPKRFRGAARNAREMVYRRRRFQNSGIGVLALVNWEPLGRLKIALRRHGVRVVVRIAHILVGPQRRTESAAGGRGGCPEFQ